jgi:hypothetical protein
MIHHVYANQTNIGDWLSARAIQSLLLPHRVTEHFCDKPFVSETIAALSKAGPDDFVIIGGGGLFMDYFVPFWEGFRPIAERVRFCIWGVGYCDLKREFSRAPDKLLEEIIRRSYLCVVRDEMTLQQLPTCCYPSPVCCPAMSLVATLPLGLGVLHVDAGDNVGAANYELMEVTGKHFAARTGRPFQSINNEIQRGNEKALAQTLEKYAGADLIVTGRLHGCIIGLAMGRKVLVVSGDRKIESFMKAADLQDWVIDVNEAREQLPNRLERLPRQPSVAGFVARERAANLEVARRLRTFLDGDNPDTRA